MQRAGQGRQGRENALREANVADIDVERKRSGVTAWLAGLAAAGFLAWALAALLWPGGREAGGEARVATEVVPVPAAEAAPATVVAEGPGAVRVLPERVAGAVRAYSEYVEGTPVPEMGADHRYVAGGVTRLTDALRQIVQSEPSTARALEPKAVAFYSIAGLLASSPDSVRFHADWMRGTALAAAGVLEDLATTRFAGDTALRKEVAEVRRAAERIRAGEPLLAQRAEVQAFFRAAADPLRMMQGTSLEG